jgi:hypothetical protein
VVGESPPPLAMAIKEDANHGHISGIRSPLTVRRLPSFRTEERRSQHLQLHLGAFRMDCHCRSFAIDRSPFALLSHGGTEITEAALLIRGGKPASIILSAGASPAAMLSLRDYPFSAPDTESRHALCPLRYAFRRLPAIQAQGFLWVTR